ncbi:MAG: rod shape-determining protein RodA [Spirochaetota bacterium]
MANKSALNNYDFLLILSVIIIAAIGIVTVYSAGYDPITDLNNNIYRRQMLWFIIGFFTMLAMTFVDYKILGDYSLHIYGVLLLILVLTTYFGTPIRNTRAWISFGSFSIQPSEFMKLGLILVLAKYIEIRERDIKHFRELLIPSLLTIIPVIFIVQQPDFGTAMIYIPLLFAILFVGGADVSHLLSIILIAAISLLVPMVITYREWSQQEANSIIIEFFRGGYHLYMVSGILFLIGAIAYVLHLIRVDRLYRRIYIPSFVISLGLLFSVIIQRYFKEYQKKRILVFLDPNLDPFGSGYNVIQSKIAIGSGGFLGKGFLKGTQAQLGFLPEKTSDFIFAVVAEEWGFVGASIVILLLFIIIYRGLKIALETKDKFGAILATGITSIFFFHTMINIGMAIGIMPVTGLPLSFVSYGGSNMLMAMIGVGLLISIKMNRSVM